MIPGLDSATPPTRAQARAARAAGVRAWNGYLATRPGVGLARPWTAAEFAVVREVFGAPPIGYCSGWDDPAAVRRLAAALGVRPGLDVEDEIRPDGPWVQAWLDAAGAGLYGALSVFVGRRAAFCVLGNFPGRDPGATWPGRPPPAPHGWQWQGTHAEFGVGVDRGWYEDWFAGDPPDPPAPSPSEEQGMFICVALGQLHTFRVDGNGRLQHTYYVPGQGWQHEQLATGCRVGETVGGNQGYNDQVHVFAELDAGGLFHWYYDAAAGRASSETLA